MLLKTKPTYVKEYRGKFVLKQSDSDELYVCVQESGGFTWKKVSLS